MAEQQPSLDQLPNELLAHISNFLRSEDINSLRLVSHRLSDALGRHPSGAVQPPPRGFMVELNTPGQQRPLAVASHGIHQNGVPNGVQNGVQNGAPNGVQNGVLEILPTTRRLADPAASTSPT